MAQLLGKLDLSGKSALITTKDHDANIYKSARNISRVDVSPFSGLNALSVLKVDKLVLTTGAVEELNASISAS
jgi:large subunit ribosomal protein L4